jgi:hypothetical protein
MKKLLWFACTLGVASLALGASATPPNIVMIISDDHHWADYSFTVFDPMNE